MSDFLSIDVGETRIDSWLSYRLDSNLLVPADGFSMELSSVGSTVEERRLLDDVLKPGVEVKAYISRTAKGGRTVRVLQHTGILEVRAIRDDKSGGTTVSCQCRDLAAHLTDSSVDLDAAREAGTNFVDMVKALVAPWNIEIELDAQASRHIATGQTTTTRAGRLARSQARRAGIPPRVFSSDLVRLAQRRRVPIDEVLGAEAADVERAGSRARREMANALTMSDVERVRLDAARPQAGETVWDFIARHASRFGLMVWFDPRGKLVIAAPYYGDEPTHRLVRRLRSNPHDPNNILFGEQSLNLADRYRTCKVYGRTFAKDVTRSRFSATAIDDSLPYERPLIIHDQSVRSEEEALRAAKRELARHRMNAELYTYTVRGHGNDQHLFAIDTMVDVDDEVLGVRGRFYVYARTFIGNKTDGTTAILKLMPPGAITL